MIKVVVNKEEFNVAPGVVALVPGPGMRVDVPAFTEINGRDTLEFCRGLGQRKWEWISTGPIFQELFSEVFRPEDLDGHPFPLPKTVEELNAGSFDVCHIAGLIILSVEAIVERKESVFLREPETHLHPKQVRCLMGLVYKLRALGGQKEARP